MDIEHVHEHADLERVPIEIRITRGFDQYYAAVRRRQHRLRALRNRARRIAKELKDENEHDPRKYRRHQPADPGQCDRNQRGQAKERPAFAGNDRMRIVFVHRGAGAHGACWMPGKTPDGQRRANYALDALRGPHFVASSIRRDWSAACSRTALSRPRALSSAFIGAGVALVTSRESVPATPGPRAGSTAGTDLGAGPSHELQTYAITT